MAQQIYFNITFACNNLCIFCAADFYGNSFNVTPDLHPKDFRRILTQLCVQPGDRVVLNGGEPTSHEGLFEMLAIVKDSGALPVLFTNGVTLSDKKVAMRIAKLQPIRICIPFFGATAERHDSLTQRRGSFRKALDGFSNLIRLSEEGWAIELEAKLLLCKATSAENMDIAHLLMTNFERGFYFSLNPLIFSRKVIENKDLLVESFPAMKLHTMATIDFITVSGLDVELKAIPFCVLDKKYVPLLPPLREDLGDYYYFDGRFVEPGLEAPVAVELCSDKCRPCLYKRICCGFDREYLKIFGSNEIQPVLEQGPHVL